MAGVIPTIVSERSSLIGGVDVYASPNAFGAQIGAAVEGLGGALSGLAAKFKAEKDKQDEELRQTRVAQSTADSTVEFTKMQGDAQQNYVPGQPMADDQVEKMRQHIEDKANSMQDPLEAAAYRQRMYPRLAEFAGSNYKFQLDQEAGDAQSKAANTLTSLENSIRMNPDSYKQVWIDGNAIIESSTTLPAAARADLKTKWLQRTTVARFNALLDGANSTDDFDAIEADLKRDVFQKALTGDQMNSLANQVQSGRKTFMNQATVAVTASIEAAEKRIDDNFLIPPDELAGMRQAALDTRSAIVLRRYAKLERDNQLMLELRDKSASEINGAANSVVAGNFGLPDTVNRAVQEAVTMFPGVPASYFGGTIQREYGRYLGDVRQADRKFAPHAASSNVILNDVNPGVYNAVTAAGELLGMPLTVTSGYRSASYQRALRFAKGKNPLRSTIAKDSQHTHGNAVDISTAGMSPQQKARVFDALLQSGFNAFGDYGSYIHADMRSNAPATVGKNGSNWLGWTNTSPEVMSALTARGYGPGAAPNASAIRDDKNIDYGKGAVGGGTSALGLGQFTEKTWLGLTRDPALAKRVGIPEGLSDQQLLDMRKDPRMSVLMIGAYAEQNAKILRNVLGREPDAAEMYIAHFLGGGDTTTLFTAYRNSPDALAKDLLPDAYKNNKSVFEDKSGRPLTVKQMHDNLVVSFSRAPNQAQYDTYDRLTKMAKGRREKEENDTMTTYRDTVLQRDGLNDLSQPGGFEARAPYVKAAADLYNLTISDAKPFTQDEAAKLKQIAVDGSVNDKLALMENIAAMDKRVEGTSAAALNQLGIKDTALSVAAENRMNTGNGETAEQIIRGLELLKGKDGKSDTGYANSIFTSKDFPTDQTGRLFNDAVGPLIRNLGGDAYGAYLGATRAYYAQRFGSQEFNADDFATAAQIVTGADNKAEINGAEVIVPPGIQPQQLEMMIETLTDADIVELSETGKVPLDVEGNPVEAQDIRDYGQLDWTGGYTYRIRMRNDGKFLTTGEMTANGTLLPYRIIADPKTVAKLGTRPSDITGYSQPGALPEDQAGVGGGSVVTDEQRRKLFGGDTVTGQ